MAKTPITAAIYLGPGVHTLRFDVVSGQLVLEPVDVQLSVYAVDEAAKAAAEAAARQGVSASISEPATGAEALSVRQRFATSTADAAVLADGFAEQLLRGAANFSISEPAVAAEALSSAQTLLATVSEAAKAGAEIDCALVLGYALSEAAKAAGNAAFGHALGTQIDASAVLSDDQNARARFGDSIEEAAELMARATSFIVGNVVPTREPPEVPPWWNRVKRGGRLWWR